MGDTERASVEQIEATKRDKGITTSLDYYAPPQFQWSAWYGEWDGDPECQPDSIGNGPTELAAIQDLLDNYDAPDEYRAMYYGVVILGHITFFNSYEDAKSLAYEYRGTILNMSGLIIDRPVDRYAP